MQIIVDTLHDKREHVVEAIELLQRVYGVLPSTAFPVIHPDDNPEKGKPAEPTISQLTAELQARNLPPPPSLTMPAPAVDPAAVFGQPPAVDPAAVFGQPAAGGAVAHVPPAALTGTAVAPLAAAAVTVPAVPASGPASAPTTGAASPSTGAELDAEGIPWDPRIHAGSKTKTKPGLWVAKRGVNDAALVQRVKAELRALMALPGPAAAAPAQMPLVPVAAPPAPFVSPAGAAVGLPTAPLPPGSPEAAFAATQPAAPPVPPAAAVTIATYAGPTTFPDLITAFTPAMSQGRLTTDMMNEACNSAGVPSLPLLAQRPDLIPQVYAYVTQRIQL